ncbi:MAG: substrate-binding domain-containing protein [Kiritimatiellales bacterium]
MADMRKVMFISELTRGYPRELLRGIVRYVRLHGTWSVHTEFIGDSNSNDSRMKLDPLLEFSESDIDGVISRDIERAGKFIRKGIPTIMAVQPPKIRYKVPHIILDHRAIGQMAAEHLISRGVRNFAYCGYKNTYWSESRLEGFHSFLAEAGFSTDVFVFSPAVTRSDRQKERKRVCQWLKSLPAPVGMMAVDDEAGRYIITLCNMMDIHVPEDLAIIGVSNDDMLCDFCNPPLSSIALNGQHAGFEAAALLDKMMAGQNVSDQQLRVSPVRVVTRQSTDIVAVEDPYVSKALYYIRNNVKTNIKVQDVLQYTHISRRALERRFEKHLNSSIHKKIQSSRVETMARLLCETSLLVSEIADEMGFDGVEHVSRYFKREKGMSPQEFRFRYGIQSGQ